MHSTVLLYGSTHRGSCKVISPPGSPPAYEVNTACGITQIIEGDRPQTGHDGHPCSACYPEDSP